MIEALNDQSGVLAAAVSAAWATPTSPRTRTNGARRRNMSRILLTFIGTSERLAVDGDGPRGEAAVAPVAGDYAAGSAGERREASDRSPDRDSSVKPKLNWRPAYDGR